MTTIQQVILQEINEERFNRKHIDQKIRKAIESSPEAMAKVQLGVEYVNLWRKQEFYESKVKRLAQLEGMDIQELVMDIFIGVSYCLKPELFTSAAAQMAARLKFSDKVEAITTVAELLAILCHTDAFHITKADRNASLMIVGGLDLPPAVITFMVESQFLPPMVCEPLPLTHNYCSGYLTHNDSLILGSGNHHDGDICLDALNIMNSVPLSLNQEFLLSTTEEPTFELDTPEKVESWREFRSISARFYVMLISQGNRFWLTNKYDKRGRAYASGYHINTQGAPYKKAMVELADKELVTGVPFP